MTPKEIETYIEFKAQEIQTTIKSHSRNWLIAFGVAVILIIVLLITVFRKTTDANETFLKNQQVLLDSLSNQQKVIAAQDRARDSVYWANYVKAQGKREGQLQQTKKKTDEVINRINQPDFNADSIQKWWANN